MKAKDLRNAGLLALAAGIVLIPVARYIMRRSKAADESETPKAAASGKGLFSAYLGKHKLHHRKAHLN